MEICFLQMDTCHPASCQSAQSPSCRISPSADLELRTPRWTNHVSGLVQSGFISLMEREELRVLVQHVRLSTTSHRGPVQTRYQTSVLRDTQMDSVEFVRSHLVSKCLLNRGMSLQRPQRQTETDRDHRDRQRRQDG
ncbi:unnamed protein product [Pleuronectes platessa]|uniref:Uncharacterized protein n=1 Tax=Pleuronectes platessa TaxID=8262 RepID=A0A9N7VUH8_PLEPL|nr:unnamed protein product [Pleuronectes platessa]